MPNDDSSASHALRHAILSHVNDAQGIKATQLVADVVLAIGGHAVDEDFAEALDKLIEDGEIIEIEYVLADMDYRIKSFLLPKGSKIRKLRGGNCVFMFTPGGDPSHTELPTKTPSYLVESLRENAVYWTGTSGLREDLLNLAADEIERLRAGLETIAQTANETRVADLRGHAIMVLGPNAKSPK